MSNAPSISTVGGVRLDAFVAAVADLVEHPTSELELAERVANELRQALADGFVLPESHVTPDPERYVMYPLYIDTEGRFSVASAVWDVGQCTPVHGHETWGVVGIYSGIEKEISYAKPTAEGGPLTSKDESAWAAGQVTVCCTTDDDVHQVFCGGNEPCVGIHVYGADIGTLPRRCYEPQTGAVSWFISRWSESACGAASGTSNQGEP